MSHSLFAIITFRDSGPLKTWSAVEAANVHNARTKPLAHAMPDAPKPDHLVGSGHLVTDIKATMRRAGIDPKRLQKNGVIAYEAILTASASFFERETEEEKQRLLDCWVSAQKEWALQRYGAHRVVSMVLHLDEKVPHIHLIVCPLEAKPDGRFKDKARVRWRLVGRTISGPGRFDETQDQYAAAMSMFGLVRGVKGSGAKYEPVPVYLKRMAEKEQAVDAAQDRLTAELADVAADRDRNALDRAAVDAGFCQLAEAAKALAAERTEHAARVATDTRSLDDARQRLAWDRGVADQELASDRRKLEQDRAELEKEQHDHAALMLATERRVAVANAQIRDQLMRLQVLQDEAKRDRDAAAADRVKAARIKDAAIEAQRAADLDRAALADERKAVEERAEKLNANGSRLLPVLRAARQFQDRLATVRDQPLTPAALSTRQAVEALARAAALVTPPADEVRPDVLAYYDKLNRRGAALGR